MISAVTKITVVIPTFNRAKFLKEAIDSVLNQTYEKFVLLVADNCSTDNTEDLVRSYNDPRIIFHKHSKNIGMQQNWEFCLNYPEDGFIALLESDNYWRKDHLQEFVDKIKEYSEMGPLFYCSRTISFGNKKNLEYKPDWLESTCFWKFTGEENYFKLAHGSCMASSSVVFHAKLRSKVNWTLGCQLFNMDYYWWFQMFFDEGFLFNNNATVFYRWHDTNVTYVYNNPRSASQFRFLQKYIIEQGFEKYYDKGNIYNILNNTPNYVLSSLLIALLSNDVKKSIKDEVRRYINSSNFQICMMKSKHFKVAQILGIKYLLFADVLDRVRGSWWPPKIKKIEQE
jgi:glycosyltransferase involved in cell wall biosynthesis